jgi:hypothetical protein
VNQPRRALPSTLVGQWRRVCRRRRTSGKCRRWSFIWLAGDPRLGMQSPILAEARITAPSGLESVIRSSRTVTLADVRNPFSALVSQLDSTVVNETRVFTTSYDAITRTGTTRSPEGRESVTTLDAKGRVVVSRPRFLYQPL